MIIIYSSHDIDKDIRHVYQTDDHDLFFFAYTFAKGTSPTADI